MANTEDMLHFSSEVNFKGYTLIIPSVSIGNVGQLSVDLLISNLKAQRIGFIWHPAVMPVIGGYPYNTNSQTIMTSSEVYCIESLKLVIVQIRSPLLKKLTQDFLLKLVTWVKDSNISKVIVLTSSWDFERRDEQIRGIPLRYLMSSSLSAVNENMLKSLQWTALEQRALEQHGASTVESKSDESSQHPEHYIIPGGGFAKKLYDVCAVENIPAAILLKFCSEGDNIPDAVILTEYLNSWLNILPIVKESWDFPPSWKYLFGNPQSKNM